MPRFGAYAVMMSVAVKIREPIRTTGLHSNLLQRKLHKGPTMYQHSGHYGSNATQLRSIDYNAKEVTKCLGCF